MTGDSGQHINQFLLILKVEIKGRDLQTIFQKNRGKNISTEWWRNFEMSYLLILSDSAPREFGAFMQ